jgi:GT2 family glycosyltransferase
MSIRVSLIIPHRNRWPDLLKCLESIAKMNPLPDETIIVDDASNSYLEVKDKFSFNIKTVQLEHHRGTAAAKNEGAKLAKGDYLWFIDSDCEVAVPNMLEHGLEKFDAIERLGVLGGEGLWDEDKKQWQLKIKTSYPNFDTCEELQTAHAREDFDVDIISTCNFLISKRVFDSLGGFTEIIEIGEDKELCARLKTLGYVLRDSSHFFIAHHASSAEKELRLRRFFFKNHTNQLKVAILSAPLKIVLFLPVVDIISKYRRFCDQSKAISKSSSAAHGPQAQIMNKYRSTIKGRLYLYSIFLLILPLSYLYIMLILPVLLIWRRRNKIILKLAKKEQEMM